MTQGNYSQGGYQQQSAPPPPYGPNMSGGMNNMNHMGMSQMSTMGGSPQMGPGRMHSESQMSNQMGQMNPIGQMGPVASQVNSVGGQINPLTPMQQMSQMNPISQMTASQANQMNMNMMSLANNPYSQQQQMMHQPRAVRWRRSNSYQPPPVANTVSPPLTPGGSMNPSGPGGPYMSISDGSNPGYNPNQFDVKPSLVPNTSVQETGMEDVKPPRPRKNSNLFPFPI